jgi:hypothetical protein
MQASSTYGLREVDRMRVHLQIADTTTSALIRRGKAATISKQSNLGGSSVALVGPVFPLLAALHPVALGLHQLQHREKNLDEIQEMRMLRTFSQLRLRRSVSFLRAANF